MIVPRRTDVERIISFYYDKYKGENAFKLFVRISNHFVGISRERIQDWINHQPRHFKLKPKFSNKEKLRPVIAHRPWQIVQVDLVDFTAFPSRSNSKRYSYVLAVLDVFSRYLILNPLLKKESKEVAAHLSSIFKTFGNPEKTDQGSEFKGIFTIQITYYYVIYLLIKKVTEASYNNC